MKTVEVGNNVKVHYVGTLADGTEFDSSHNREEPLAFEVGSGNMLRGFDSAVVGMSEGETKSFTLSPAEAYGDRIEEAIQPVPMAAFGPDFEFILGGPRHGNSPRVPFLAKIHALEEEAQEVLLDMNHPLAGEELSFDIEMVEIDTSTNGTTDFGSLTVPQLKTLAKERGFKGYSTLKKTELVQLLSN